MRLLLGKQPLDQVLKVLVEDKTQVENANAILQANNAGAMEALQQELDNRNQQYFDLKRSLDRAGKQSD